MSKTNAQKYEEIFGFPPDEDMCPTKDCKKCPVDNYHDMYCINEWWDSEYKEPEDKDGT